MVKILHDMRVHDSEVGEGPHAAGCGRSGYGSDIDLEPRSRPNWTLLRATRGDASNGTSTHHPGRVIIYTHPRVHSPVRVPDRAGYALAESDFRDGTGSRAALKHSLIGAPQYDVYTVRETHANV